MRGLYALTIWVSVQGVMRAFGVAIIPTTAESVPLWHVLIRPSGDVLLLASASRSTVWEFVAVWTVAAFSRFVQDLFTFWLARSVFRNSTQVWAVAAARWVSKLPPRILVVLAAVYSPLPLILLLALSNARFAVGISALALNGLVIPVFYLLLGSQTQGLWENLIEFIGDHRLSMTAVLVPVAVLSLALRFRGLGNLLPRRRP